MSAKTGIEWTDATWNPTRGCSRVSEGCRNCYAERQAARFSKPGEPFHGVVEDGKWTGKVALVPEKLAEPLSWRKPSRVFVNSMSDLFHEALPDEAIDRVFAVMAIASRHTFQVLTKRPERMRAYLTTPDLHVRLHEACKGIVGYDAPTRPAINRGDLPLRNVWLGVSVEDQATADARIPHLLATPAAVRFVSYEPALGPVDFRRIDKGSSCEFDALIGGASVLHDSTIPREDIKIDGLDWLIVGGESGPGARPCDLAWVRSAVAQCKAAGLPVFVKQLGALPFDSVTPCECFHDDEPITKHRGCHVDFRDRKGGDPSEWPADLRVREFPR